MVGNLVDGYGEHTAEFVVVLLAIVPSAGFGLALALGVFSNNSVRRVLNLHSASIVLFQVWMSYVDYSFC